MTEPISTGHVNDTPGEDFERFKHLALLGHSQYQSYTRSNDVETLNEAIRTFTQSTQATPSNDPKLYLQLSYLSLALKDRYSITKQRRDLDEALQATKRAVQLMETDGSCLAIRATVLHANAADTEAESDHREAVQFARYAMRILEQDNSSRTTISEVLCNLLDAHYKETQSENDLEELIILYRHLDHSTPKESGRKMGLMINLAYYLRQRFKSRPNPQDIDESIMISQRLIQFAAEDDPRRTPCLINYAVYLWERFIFTERRPLDDLDEAIRVIQQLTDYWLAYFTRLSAYVAERYCTTKLPEHYIEAAHHLPKAIQYWRQATKIPVIKTKYDLGPLLYLYGKINYGQFRDSGSAYNLNQAIEAFQESAELTDSPSELRKSKDWLLTCLLSKYSISEALCDLDDIISLARQLAQESPEGSKEQTKYALHAAEYLTLRYYRIARLEDMEESIQLGRRALGSTSKDDLMYPMYQSMVGVSLGEYFTATGSIPHLEESLQLTRVAAHTLPQSHTRKGEALMHYGSVLMKHYTTKGELSVLEEAIATTEEAIATGTSEDDLSSDLPYLLSEMLLQRFYVGGLTSDLDRGIRLCNEALNQGELYQTTRSDLISVLTTLHFHRSRVPGENPEPNTIDYLSSAALDPNQLGPIHPRKLKQLASASLGLGNKFLEAGHIVELEKAIQLGREAVDLLPESHQALSEVLSNLGVLIGLKYARKGMKADMDEATLLHRKAVDATPAGHFARPQRLAQLSSHLSDRFNSFGQIADLDEAIRLIQISIDGTPVQHVELIHRERTLATLLSVRYGVIGRTHDLEEAIRIGEKCIEKAAKNDMIQGWHLDHLATQLRSLFLRTRNISLLEDAIMHGDAAVNKTDQLHAHYTGRANNLLACLIEKYKVTREEQDFDKAINIGRKAIDAAPPDHPDRVSCLSNFGFLMCLRSIFQDSKTDLEIAIRILQKALNAIPEEDVTRSPILNLLGSCYIDMYNWKKQKQLFQKAINYYNEASQIANAPTLNKLESYWGRLRFCAHAEDWRQALEAASAAIQLIPNLVLRTLNHSDKQNLIRRINHLACDAASVYLLAGRDSAEALSVLEQGRGIISSSIEDMRTDISELKMKHPQLAEEFVQLKNRLENMRFKDRHATRSVQELESSEEMPVGDWTAQLGSGEEKELGDVLSRLITNIRTKPGFEHFLLPPSSAEIYEAAKQGPIVVIIISQVKCHAVIIKETNTIILPLPDVSPKILEQKAKSSGDLGTTAILEWLWDSIAKPVLDELGFTEPVANGGTWPHICWVPTGILGMFPLHAAGRHFTSTSETVLDRAASSYSLSHKSLVKSRLSPRIDAPSLLNAVLVGMRNTPRLRSLPFVEKELDSVRKYLELMNVNLIEPRKSRPDVLSAIQQCTLFHFAGHGYTSRNEPLDSYLALGEAKQDPLTVAHLLEIDIQTQRPFLAYLSACQTGRMDDDESSNESIHLISAFQLAGFRHVIGTLWKVDDQYCVDMAALIYKSIAEGGMTDLSVCMGLHNASRALRARWVRAESERRARYRRRSFRSTGSAQEADLKNQSEVAEVELSRDVISCDEEEEDFHWARYVHFGL
ncbi:unnamed protein product [Clonostachys rosea]|uniref:CHAT domain-containing protein n=1 Tax=Bionectria ochroleuca TaxID=29856 RepID=A0ABY6UYW5_BIOOC|nr:unnamed protein product [Clonostachys rosea]